MSVIFVEDCNEDRKQRRCCFVGLARLAKLALCLLTFLCAVPLAHAQADLSDTTIGDVSGASGERQDAEIRSRRHGDWTYRCLVSSRRSEDAPEPECEISQSVQVEQGGALFELFNVALTHVSDESGKVEWALAVLVPFGLDIHLPSDFGLAVGSENPLSARFRNCDAEGCWVVVPVDDSLLANLKLANNGAGLFRLLSGKAVKVEFSLAGFAEAFNALASGNLPEEQNIRRGEVVQ